MPVLKKTGKHKNNLNEIRRNYMADTTKVQAKNPNKIDIHAPTLRVHEAAEAKQCSKSTIYRKIRAGKLDRVFLNGVSHVIANEKFNSLTIQKRGKRLTGDNRRGEARQTSQKPKGRPFADKEMARWIAEHQQTIEILLLCEKEYLLLRKALAAPAKGDSDDQTREEAKEEKPRRVPVSAFIQAQMIWEGRYQAFKSKVRALYDLCEEYLNNYLEVGWLRLYNHYLPKCEQLGYFLRNDIKECEEMLVCTSEETISSYVNRIYTASEIIFTALKAWKALAHEMARVEDEETAT
jgi:hypothetical protein